MARIFLFLFLIIPSFTKAQEVSPEFIGTSGQYTETINGSLSWAIGEPVTEAVTDGSNLLSQGFEQGYLTVEQIDDQISNHFRIYPNPTSNILIIEGEETGIDYKLVNISGQIIKTGTTANNLEEVDLSDFRAGIYILKISNSKFKIIKH